MNVYDKAIERIEYLFKNFEQVIVAFSGGKDSAVCLNLAIDYAKKSNNLNKLGVYHLDYEAQYEQTTTYVKETFENLPCEINKWWLCLPIKAQCSTSMFQQYWVPWEYSKKDLWVRKMPNYDYVINENNVKFEYNDWDYIVQNNFCDWVSNNKKTAIIVGIRTQESFNRWRAVFSDTKVNYFENKKWTTSKSNYVLSYPIFDWTTQDVWVCNARFNYKYNSLYDLFYQAGLSIDQMRVASPFNDYAKSSLKYYKVIDPNNWGKMISRVNGVNCTAIYGDTTAMGWKNITKPKHFTWKDYMYFLLSTLPKETRENYLNKLEASKKSWKVGGARSNQTIQELLDENAPVILTGKTNNRGSKSKQVIVFEDYLDDTNVTDFKSVPTYKRMCICIMKNDFTCKYMGFTQTKNEIKKRKDAVKKYENIL